MKRGATILHLVIMVLAAIFVLSNNLYATTGEEIFSRVCSSCHGNKGAGDGPVGKALPPGLLPDLTSSTRKFATDEAKLKELIQKGGAAVGLSPLMPAQPSLNDDQLNELVKYVSSLKR